MGFRPFRIASALALTVTSGLAHGQQPNVTITQLDEETYRYAVAAERRQILAANIGLPPGDLGRFWAIYDEYEKARAQLDKDRFSVVSRYFQSYATMNDAQAMALVIAASQVQVSEIQLRAKYAEILGRKLSGRAGGRFFLIDDYVSTELRFKSLQNLPISPATP